MLPEAIVVLRLSLAWLFFRRPFALEGAFAMVLSLEPFTCVAALTTVKDEVAELAGFALLKVPKVDLFKHIRIKFVEDSNEASAVRLLIDLGTVVYGSIWKFRH